MRLTAGRWVVGAATAVTMAAPLSGDADDVAGVSQQRDEFVPTRIQYDSIGGQRHAYYFYDGRWWQRWETDFPQAEQNFAKRLNELTSVVAAAVPVQRRLTDPDLGDSPLIFMSDVGYMELSEPETDALRTYLGLDV